MPIELHKDTLQGNGCIDLTEICPGHKKQLRMSRIMRKPNFCLCENKDADQLPAS